MLKGWIMDQNGSVTYLSLIIVCFSWLFVVFVALFPSYAIRPYLRVLGLSRSLWIFSRWVLTSFSTSDGSMSGTSLMENLPMTFLGITVLPPAPSNAPSIPAETRWEFTLKVHSQRAKAEAKAKIVFHLSLLILLFAFASAFARYEKALNIRNCIHNPVQKNL